MFAYQVPFNITTASAGLYLITCNIDFIIRFQKLGTCNKTTVTFLKISFFRVAYYLHTFRKSSSFVDIHTKTNNYTEN